MQNKFIHIIYALPPYVGRVSDYDRTLFDKIYNILQKKDLFGTVRKIIHENFEKEGKVKIVLEYVGYGYKAKV